jgi:hypothetical protein
MMAAFFCHHACQGSKTSAGDKIIGGQRILGQENVIQPNKFRSQGCEKQRITKMTKSTANVREAAAAAVQKVWR